MEDILDGLRRIVSRWVDTTTPITQPVSAGETTINIRSSKRFEPGDEVMIEGLEEGEPMLVVEDVPNFESVVLATPVHNDWSLDENIVLRKLINGMFVQGIYIGDPAVISHYPAITVSGNDEKSEWFTLDSTKDRFEVELTVMVEDDTHEDGYRFMMRMVKAIKHGLRKNFYPLVNDYETTAITAPIIYGDELIQVADSSIFNTNLTDTTEDYPRVSDARAIIENRWRSEETRVQEILSPTVVAIRPQACHEFALSENPILIYPKRHIFNSWPHHISYGKMEKDGSLLQTAVIRWFGEENVIEDFMNDDPHLK